MLSGVCQGSLLGGIFWSLYLDDLIVSMRKSQLGCCQGSRWFGAAAYAYDICILSPTFEGLRRLCAIIEKYCFIHQIRINPLKSQLLSRSPPSPTFRLFLDYVPLVTSIKYLGFSFKFSCRGHLVVSESSVLAKFFIAVNGVLSIPNSINPQLRMKLICSFSLCLTIVELSTIYCQKTPQYCSEQSRPSLIWLSSQM